jgi:hypothetical protein
MRQPTGLAATASFSSRGIHTSPGKQTAKVLQPVHAEPAMVSD